MVAASRNSNLTTNTIADQQLINKTNNKNSLEQLYHPILAVSFPISVVSTRFLLNQAYISLCFGWPGGAAKDTTTGRSVTVLPVALNLAGN